MSGVQQIVLGHHNGKKKSKFVESLTALTESIVLSIDTCCPYQKLELNVLHCAYLFKMTKQCVNAPQIAANPPYIQTIYNISALEWLESRYVIHTIRNQGKQALKKLHSSAHPWFGVLINSGQMSSSPYACLPIRYIALPAQWMLRGRELQESLKRLCKSCMHSPTRSLSVHLQKGFTWDFWAGFLGVETKVHISILLQETLKFTLEYMCFRACHTAQCTEEATLCSQWNLMQLAIEI